MKRRRTNFTYSGNVEAFTFRDLLQHKSGIRLTATVTSDTAPSGMPFTCTGTSVGGTGSASVTIKRDATPPLVSVVGVQEGVSYPAVDPPEIGCSASDPVPGSGLVFADPPATISDLGDGLYSARCYALDKVNNSAAATVSYRLVSLDLISAGVEASSLNGG